MSGLLRLANEFIERMMNPAYGPLVNDDYSMRLAEFLADDSNTETLMYEAERLSRIDDLSAHTWMWLIGLPEARTRIDRDLLRDLCLEFEAASFRATIIDSVMRESPRLETGEAVAFVSPSLDGIQNPWLQSLVRAVVREEDVDRSDPPPDETRSSPPVVSRHHSAPSMLVALLTVNRGACHQAASALLHHEWVGHAALLEFFESRIAAMDPESRAQWLLLAPDVDSDDSPPPGST
jgi:hypothetical protein